MALYRKYRPATFAEVVGQEHVTEPLCTSLDSGRINHAYLFSGPRGCGKTSSARILARSLNCVEGPTSTPCGVCDSCVALAPGGSGTLDVTELDAATHNGVDDMRELRDRAFYAPAESRYRVFIIDEAHMISQAGFNALLKIVEEPPEHLIFIFATTEPEKLLQTIRSRTHNYPFRLLTPPMMRGLLERICGDEGVAVEDAVYPLVIRAGGGSPRDSLSVMDQLLAGAGPEGVTYTRAVALLGVTDSALLDRTVDALATSDQAGLFSVISDVIDAGHDPRRFTMDLLDRFRDLLVVKSVPEAFDTGLVDAPVDQREVLTRQASELGTATLTRCAALVNEGLMQMRGATSPRLLLEILCARMALPAAGMTVESLAQRVEALESGQVGARSVGAAVSSGSGFSSSDTPRYVRKSQRTPSSEGVETPQTLEATEPVPEVVVEQVADVAPESVPEPEPAPESVPGVAPDAAIDVADLQKPVESPQEDDGLTEAERAREIMRRNRRRDSLADQSTTSPGVAVPTPDGESADQPADVSVAGPEADAAPGFVPGSVEESVADLVADPVAQWPEILAALHDIDLSAWIAARDATPTACADGHSVVLHHHTGALANFINDPAHAEAYASAATSVMGVAITVRAEVGSPGKSDADTPAVEEPERPVSEALARAKAQEGTQEAALRQVSATPGRPTSSSSSPSGSLRDTVANDGQPLTGWRARLAKNSSQPASEPSESFGGDSGIPLPEEPGEPWDDGAEASAGTTAHAASSMENSAPYDVASEAADALAQLDDPTAGTLDHRSALEIAGELLETSLGAERTR